MDQKFLLKIVQTWHIKAKPEFRGFKCGICERVLHKAWYNWLDYHGFKTPVHLCKDCQEKLEIKYPNAKIYKSKIRVDLTNKINKTVKEIVKKWKISTRPIYKIFLCDFCKKNIYQAYHVWINLDNIVSEIHFCKKCGDYISLNKIK